MINIQIPEKLSEKMPINTKGLRLASQTKTEKKNRVVEHKQTDQKSIQK